MATWTEIDDSRLEPGAPARSVDAIALRDNPVAIAEGASGAPRIQTGGLQDNAVTANKIDSNAVTTPKIAFGSSSLSGSVDDSSTVNITMDDFSLFPAVTSNSDLLRMETVIQSSASASSPRFALLNSFSESNAYDVAWRYIS